MDGPSCEIQFCTDDRRLWRRAKRAQEDDRAREGGELRPDEAGPPAQDALGLVRVSGLLERGQGMWSTTSMPKLEEMVQMTWAGISNRGNLFLLKPVRGQ